MSDGDANRDELGAFLRARRAELTPQAVGLADTGTPRRVPGLRREEVAQLVAISTDYYARIEQGRISVSGPVLEAIGRVLGLDETQNAYLRELAGRPSVARPRRRAPQRLDPQMRRVLDGLTEWPAMVLGRHLQILGWNRQAAALIADFGAIPEAQRNYVRMIFTDPRIEALFPDWDAVVRSCVATLRLEAGRFPDDPELAGLVGDLSMKHPDFRERWAARHVQSHGSGTKRFRHAVAGDLTLDWQTLTCPTDPEQHLTIYSAEPGSPSHQGLLFLSSWAAEQVERQPADPAG
ncbi:helix-turn-helix domain-containing protein [Patulibacter sp.]|uniref:helix-turn-helix domain-containing protein n=1 Tax=Patulibacter sp. TaxID=1912859 RepID=UPI002725F249|nr:helix-turn-helix transcriptional regulator [Patulibacter sp.]MDO9409422.1 helix-turn-helix transcriptional regulator [Patulibacter sp.]